MTRLRWLWAIGTAVALAPGSSWAQQPATISGRVTNESGAPIASVSVYVPALRLGTYSGADGTFRLVIPASRLQPGQAVTLAAQGAGLKTQTRLVALTPGAALTQNFTLVTDVLVLDEIVATGQGTTTTREKTVNVVNTVRAEEITKSREVNVVSALAAKAPNVLVTSSAGDPGAGTYIQIRGAASVVGGTQPLFVVDGTQIDNSTDNLEDETQGTVVTNRAADINPADIERVEILKGAAATAIYGSRAANGVVLITTKRGLAGATRATLSTSYFVDQVTSLVPLQRSYGQGYGGQPSTTTPFSWGPELNANVPTFDHAGELYQDGNRLENNLTLSGGSERTTYYLSAGSLNQDGVIKGPQGYARQNVRVKGTHFFRDDLQIGGNLAFTRSSGDFVQQGSNISGIQLGALRTPPDFNNCRNDNGYQCYLNPEGLHFSYRRRNPTSLTQSRGYDNPFWVANELRNTSTVGRGFGNLSLDYTPTTWLKFGYLLGADYTSDERLSIFPKSSAAQLQGAIFRANIVRQILDSNLTATLSGELGDRFSGSVTLGQNLNQREEWWNQVNGKTLIFGTEETDYAVTNTGDEYKEKIRIDGYFISGEGTLADQLTLSATGRWDGSSTFGGNGQRFFYPGVGASWVFTNNALFQNLPISFGKLRASWGIAGRQPLAFTTVSSFNTGYYSDGWVIAPSGLYSIYNGQEGVFRQARMANKDIKPEKQNEFELGTDLAFFDSRLALGVTYYNRKTTDAILNLPVPYSTGFSSIYRNAAEFQNKGWEATLDLTPVQNDNLSWRVGLQWATNNSCVTNLAGADYFSLAGFEGSLSAVVAPEANGGKCAPFGALYGDDFVRFGRGLSVPRLVQDQDGNWVGAEDANGNPIMVNIDETYGGAAGAIYVGEDGYPQYDDVYRVAGDPNPDWTASIRSSITVLRNLTVSGLLDIRQGGQMWNGTKGALYYFGTHKDTDPYQGEGKTMTYAQYSGSKVEGPGKGTPAVFDYSWFTGNLGSGFTGPFSQFIEDASFVKLRDLSVSYVFDQSWVRRAGFSSIDVTVSGRNLKTWTDYTGIDPESNITGQTAGRGLDYFNNPQTRSFVFTVNLNR